MILRLTLIIALLAACKSTDPVVKVDKANDKITIMSSNRSDSSLASSSDHRSIKKTIDVLTKKLKKEPRNVDLRIDLARMYLLKGEVKNARTLCRKAMSFDIHNKRGAKLLAEIEYASKNYEKAEIILARVLNSKSKKYNPRKDAEIQNLLGLIAGKRDKYDEAVLYFKKGLQIDKNNSAIRMNLGALQLKYKQLPQARIQFKKVLTHLPGHLDAKLHYAITEAYLNRNKQAIRLYKAVLEKDSNNYIAHFNLGLVQRKVDNLKEAKRHFEEAIDSSQTPKERLKIIRAERDDVVKEMKKREEEKRKQEELERKKAKALAAKKAPKS